MPLGGFQAGLAAVTITPRQSLWAAGYARRQRPVSERLSELYAKALVLQDDQSGGIAIVTTDLLGFPRAFGDDLADRIARRLKWRRDQIMLTSSHTHSGPVLRDALADIYPLEAADVEAIRAYSDWLADRLEQVVADATADLSPARLTWGQGRAGFAANRREFAPAEQVTIGVNPAGPVDHEVPVLGVYGDDGALRAALFSYACHATTLDGYAWCGDYPGFAQAKLEGNRPGMTAMFMAGCGADCNPTPRRSVQVCRAHGDELAAAVEHALAHSSEVPSGRIDTALQRIELPFERAPSREVFKRRLESGEPYEQRYAARMLERLDANQALPTGYPCPVQVCRVGDGPTLVALGGEMVVEYSRRLKQELGDEPLWVVAYANDVFGYVPTARMLDEGGYEVDEAVAVYGLPARWSPHVEEALIRGACEVARHARR